MPATHTKQSIARTLALVLTLTLAATPLACGKKSDGTGAARPSSTTAGTATPATAGNTGAGLDRDGWAKAFCAANNVLGDTLSAGAAGGDKGSLSLDDRKRLGKQSVVSILAALGAYDQSLTRLRGPAELQPFQDAVRNGYRQLANLLATQLSMVDGVTSPEQLDDFNAAEADMASRIDSATGAEFAKLPAPLQAQVSGVFASSDCTRPG